MTDKEMEVLQGLHKVIAVEPNLLDSRAHDRYNELADKADKENIVW
jgi:hypothetical protein